MDRETEEKFDAEWERFAPSYDHLIDIADRIVRQVEDKIADSNDVCHELQKLVIKCKQAAIKSQVK